MKDSNRTIVVAGGAGFVGSGIVGAFLDEGWVVFVPSRSQEKLDRLQRELGADGRLIGIVGDIGDPDASRRIADEIRRQAGPIDAAVASIGGWFQGPRLIEMKMGDWMRLTDNNLTSHVVAMQALVPLIEPNGCYAIINGTASEEPVAGAAAVCGLAAGVLMLGKTAELEQRSKGPRIRVMMLGPIARPGKENSAEQLTPQQVGQAMVKTIEDDRVGERDPVVRIDTRKSFDALLARQD